MHMHEEETTIANSKYLAQLLCQARSVLHNRYPRAHAQRTAARCTELCDDYRRLADVPMALFER